MSIKTIFIVAITVLVTIILMKNTDEVNFWIFGDAYIPKLAILGVMFFLGFVVGFIAGRPRDKHKDHPHAEEHPQKTDQGLSDEDREYIS